MGSMHVLCCAAHNERHFRIKHTVAKLMATVADREIATLRLLCILIV